MIDVNELTPRYKTNFPQVVLPGNQIFSIAFFFSSRRRHTRCGRDWSSDVCSSDLAGQLAVENVGFVYTSVRERKHELSRLPYEIGRASCREECRSRWSPYH